MQQQVPAAYTQLVGTSSPCGSMSELTFRNQPSATADRSSRVFQRLGRSAAGTAPSPILSRRFNSATTPAPIADAHLHGRADRCHARRNFERLPRHPPSLATVLQDVRNQAVTLFQSLATGTSHRRPRRPRYLSQALHRARCRHKQQKKVKGATGQTFLPLLAQKLSRQLVLADLVVEPRFRSRSDRGSGHRCGAC